MFQTLQIEGRFETLILAEEGIALKIPVGADYIESPGMLNRKFSLDDKIAIIIELSLGVQEGSSTLSSGQKIATVGLEFTTIVQIASKTLAKRIDIYPLMTSGFHARDFCVCSVT